MSSAKKQKTFHVPSSSSAQSFAIPPSPSSSALEGTYDVFLSFRGEDTPKGFLSHLYTALRDRGIHTFRDEDRLESGKSIKQELSKAIKDSKIAIIVLSENYADSSWCLNELVQILEAEPKKIVIPVFYYVDPSAIRKQKDVVAHALEKLGNIDDNRMKSWTTALTDAANFKGYDLSKYKDESECIKEIVAFVHDELSRSIPSTWEDLVGMEQRVKKVEEMLKVGESEKVIMVGIWGMGGAGKTTTARATFDKLSPSFDDGSCFLRISCGKCSENGLVDLQKTLLSEILKLNPDQIRINDSRKGKHIMKERLKFKKILVVLDNVSDHGQLKALAPEPECFGLGSRVIITTRNNKVLSKVDASYKIELLNDTEAMKLFSWHAFEKAEPEKGFVELSSKVVEHAKGLPLALQVLGSHLNGLDLDEWTSEIKQLDKVQIVPS